MKKFLQKTLALLALCIVSMGAMAQGTLSVTSTDPADGATKSLDNGGVYSVTLNLGEYINYVYESNVPDAIYCTDGVSNYKVNTIVGWDYELRLNFLTQLNKAGVYTLYVPAETYAVDGKYLPEMSVTFTLEAKTKFSFNSWSVTPRDNGRYTSIDGIVLPIPDDATFVDGTETVSIKVNDTPVSVDATVNAAAKTITLDWHPTEVGTYVVKIPAATFTDAEGLKNEELTLGYEIIPTLAINEASVDAEGNYWTTFAFDSNYTLPEGYTPYKVVEANEATGVLSVEEILGAPKVNEVDAFFNECYDYSKTPVTVVDNSFTVYDGKISVSITLGSQAEMVEDFNGFYIYTKYSSIYPTTFTITVNDPSIEIAYVKLGEWNSQWSYRDPASFVKESETVYTVVQDGNDYIGWLRIGIATGEYYAPVLPANKGILVKASEANDNVAYKSTYSSPTADMTGNLLVGCVETAVWNEAGKSYYKFSLDEDNTPGSSGFYWGIEGGSSIDAHVGKAYLVLDGTSSSNRFLFNGFGEETGISAIATESNDAIYNLQGQRVNANAAGVYVKNGKKFIVK